MNKIYVACGCFWGVQRLYDGIKGVSRTQTGYANGKDGIEPTYKKVCEGNSGYKETVCVEYDEKVVGLKSLLQAFFDVVDVTVRDKQGADVGNQYQSGIYYVDESSEKIVKEYFENERKKNSVFCVENDYLKNFFRAEDYHQKYLERNVQGYCHINIVKMKQIQDKINKKRIN